MKCPLGHNAPETGLVIPRYCLDCQYCLQGFCDFPWGWRVTLKEWAKDMTWGEL